MYRLRIFCNDGDDQQYWEPGIDVYATYSEALCACYEIALMETQDLMRYSDYNNWFEVDIDFEVTEAYDSELLKDIAFFPVATIHYDHAPWDRENDCDIIILTGYEIVEVKD